jgi:hypothetical protein
MTFSVWYGIFRGKFLIYRRYIPNDTVLIKRFLTNKMGEIKPFLIIFYLGLNFQS